MNTVALLVAAALWLPEQSGLTRHITGQTTPIEATHDGTSAPRILPASLPVRIREKLSAEPALSPRSALNLAGAGLPSTDIPSLWQRTVQAPAVLRKTLATSAIPFVIDTAVVFATTDTTRHIYAFNGEAAMVSDLSQRYIAGTWTDVTRETYAYDGHNRMTSSVHELPVNGLLTPAGRWTFSYDTSGNLVSAVEEDRDPGTDTWRVFYRYTFVYDQYGNILLNQRETLSMGTTTSGTRESYVRDGAGNILVYVYELWKNGWSGSNRVTMTWDTRGNELSDLHELFLNGSWVNSNRSTSVYDAANNMLSSLYDEWDNGQWTHVNKITRAYDEQNDATLLMFEYGNDGQLVYSYRYRYTNEGGKQRVGIGEEWHDGAWVPRHQWTNTYNAAGDRLSVFGEAWNDTAWVYSSREAYAYDAAGRLILQLGENWLNGQWVTWYRQSSAFNEKGDQTLDQYESCDSTGQTEWGYRWVTSYDRNGGPASLAYDYMNNGPWTPGDERWFFEDSATVQNRYSFTSSTHNTYSFTGYRLELHSSALEAGANKPAAIALMQNYPNPFNAGTVITYVLPEARDTRITVFDLLGQEVARLVDGTQGPGTFSVRFDPSGLPSGIYFSMLTAGSHTQTIKMVLVR